MINNDSISENRKIIASNVSWALIGKITNMLSALLVGIFVARYLGPEQYGLMNYVISFVSLSSSWLHSGSRISRYVRSRNTHKKRT